MAAIRRLAIVGPADAAIRALATLADLNGSSHRPPIITIAVHSDAESGAWHVCEADEAISLGPAGHAGQPNPDEGYPDDGYPDEAYPDEPVVQALREAGVDAVWVGWGGFAGRASFAARCEQAGIVFVGPDSDTMRLLRDPVAVSRLAERAGVPVATGSDALVAEDLVGASLVEVPVIADAYGAIWGLGVSDCSIRHGHHRIIVESSSERLDAGLRRVVSDAALRLMSAAGYRNAGSVEFLVDPNHGRYRLLGVRPWLPAEHAVIEQTTGLDLVRLQIQVAAGGRLAGRPPPPRGHAIAARVCAEDPELGFAATPGRLSVLTLPTGVGIRVDTAVREGDAAAGPEIAKIIAFGARRGEAVARLRRALMHTTIVVAGGTTNRSLLLSVLDRAELRKGCVDQHWLEHLTATRSHVPPADPVALLVAAVEAYRGDDDADRVAFHARAARGRPESSVEVGHACLLRYRGERYPLRVYRTGPSTYRVDCAGTLADVSAEAIHGSKLRVVVGGQVHRVVAVRDGPTLRVDVDGAGHTVTRDDGGVVGCDRPAFVVSVLVSRGDLVAKGDPLVVLESMKLETTVAAPYGGEVVAVAVTENAQVEAGAPLLRIRANPAASHAADTGTPVVLDGLRAPWPTSAPSCEPVYTALSSFLLGYDLDPATAGELLDRHRQLGQIAAPADAGLLRCEDELLDLFADTAALCRPRTEIAPADDHAAGVAQEYLLSYLQWLDPDRAGLPDRYRERLARALRRYGVVGLERTPALEEAVVWMFRSFRRVDQLVGVVMAILHRRLAHHDLLAGVLLASAAATARWRARLDRLAAATQGRHQVVADLARDVRFRYLDQPLLAGIIEAEYAGVDACLAALWADPSRSDRRSRIDRLVSSPQPLRGSLLRAWLLGGDDRFRELLLEVYIRRYYRAARLGSVRFIARDGYLLATTDYVTTDYVTTGHVTADDGGADDGGAHDGAADGIQVSRGVHLVTGYAPLADLPTLSRAIARHLNTVGEGLAGHDEDVLVDLTAWRSGVAPGLDVLAAIVEALLAECSFGRRLWRLDLTVTSTDGAADEHLRTQHLSYRQPDGTAFVEEPLYRNLHPMLAERLELWRLANFALQRLPSAEDVYLFHAVAHDNPADRRLFALAEVRDLTPVVDADGSHTYPRLELMGLLALAAMRHALNGLAEGDRPAANRIVLYVRPPWTIARQDWPKLARSFAPLAVGAGLQKVVLRVRIPVAGQYRESVLHVEGLERRGVTVRERPPGTDPVRPLTPYRQKVLRADRVGVPYPYEIVRMLAPPPGVLARFPTGRFVEYDLDESGTLVPVDRLPGLNNANIVVGLITNHTVTVYEGMTRVALLGDPTRGLGNLAEPECRRIIAGIDLAEQMDLPVEWFAVSSGARIAMDSGTENMDWIAAVLRRLVEFTQCGGEVNIIVTGVNVGAQPYWNAEATMLMHDRGILVMTPRSAMVLTGKQALDFSGGVSAEDNLGIGGFDRVMGPNGEGQYWAPTLEDACDILLRHYDHTYVVAGERYPRRAPTADPADRDVCLSPHPSEGGDPPMVGAVFSAEHNPERKKPFDIRAVMRAVTDTDWLPLERWRDWRGAETTVVWDAHIGGISVCLLGMESRALPRQGFVPADGPPAWTSGTLFPQSSRKMARAINAASGNRPVVVLANLAGFDGSPESMRHWQLEYGAEIGRAVTNFRGPMVFVVISRYHGGAFVVFSKRLNARLEIAAVMGSYASVIGGAPAAATVFAREVSARTERDPRIRELQEQLRLVTPDAASGLRAEVAEQRARVRARMLGAVADEFDAVHTIQRALTVGSVDRIIAAHELRPYLVEALERGMVLDLFPPVSPARPPQLDQIPLTPPVVAAADGSRR